MKRLLIITCLLIAGQVFGQHRVYPTALDNANDLLDVGGGTPFGNIGNPTHTTDNMWDNDTATKATWFYGPDDVEALVGVHSMSKRYVPTAFTLTMPLDATTRNWTNFVFEGSNDTTDGTNGTWEAIQSFSTPVLVWAEFRVYKWYSEQYNQDFVATDAYNSFRMRVTSPLSSVAGAIPHLSEIEIFGYEAEFTTAQKFTVINGGKPVVIGGKPLVYELPGEATNLVDTSNWWSPVDIDTEELISWWDGTDISTLTHISASLQQMDDKGTNGYDSVSGFGSPAIWQRSINNLNAMNYDYVGDNSMTATGIQITDGNAAVFQVWQWEGGVDNTASSAFSMNATPNLDWQFAASSLSYFRGRIVKTGLGAPNTVDLSDTAKNGPSIYNMNWNFTSNDVNVWIDGSFETNSPYTIQMGTTQQFRIMGARSEFLTIGGYCAETIIVKNMTVALRLKIEGYLAWKYNLVANLPIGHLYKTERPLK